MSKVGVVILTLNAEKHLPYLLPPLLNASIELQILVIDSDSSDRTRELCEKEGIKVIKIAKSDFNHGKTRELGRKNINCETVVFMTQDAYLLDNTTLEKLVAPLNNDKVALSYARQVTKNPNRLLETYAREFNYPEESQIRSLEHAEKWGVYTFFCSNSCSAYSNAALDEIGGFNEVLFGEDTLACAKLLHIGYKVAYVANAHVKHSHDYQLIEEFKRNFDIGLSRKVLSPLIFKFGSDSKRGVAYLKGLIRYLVKKAPWLIPYAIMNTGFKWLGYQVGSRSLKAPTWFKRLCSSQPYYFKS